MADRYLIQKSELPTGAVETETFKLEQKRNAELEALKNKALAEKAAAHAAQQEALAARTLKYDEEYEREIQERVQKTREAKEIGAFYRPAEAKVLFVVRIKGVRKMAPKPKQVLRLLRLRQIYNGVFVKVNDATKNMLKLVEPFVTYGYPTVDMIRKLIYKRGYAKLGKQAAWSRQRLTDNQIVSDALGKFGIHGVEDIIHELYTVGPHFKEVNSFLWPFKLRPPKGGFVAKRHGFTEMRGGDWGNREDLLPALVNRMI